MSNHAAVRVARTDLLASEWTAPASVFTSSTTGATLPRVRLQTDGRAAVTWGYAQGDRSPWIARGASADAWDSTTIRSGRPTHPTWWR